VTDRAGNVVIARLDVGGLREVAETGGGRFGILDGSDRQASLWVGTDSQAFERREDALGDRWQDAGPWLTLLLIPVMLVGFRRGLIFVFALGLLPALLPQNAEAGWWEDMWQRKDQQAWAALQNGEAERAAALARDPNIAAQGWYRSGDYEQAGHSWSAVPGADGHYNRGNALALQGNLDGAIAAYEDALEIDPDLEDAIYNKNVVEQMKQEQEQQQQQQQDQQGEGESQEDPSGEQNSEAGEQEPSEQEDGEQQSEGESEQESEEARNEEEGEAERRQRELQEAWSEEDAQAMEQWLRRIPDDPGGLLRRKFRNEYLERGEPESERETW
jgi:Ca-activated chloride channel family protein